MLPRTIRIASLFVSALVASAVLQADLAAAADIKATSKVLAVTVYPKGAEITRTTSVMLPPGQTTILFEDLPEDIVADTLRVEGESVGAMEIGAVETRRIVLTRTESEAMAAKRKQLETEIETLRRDQGRLAFETRAKETQRDYLVNLAGLPARGPIMAPGQGGVAASQDWAGLFDLIGASMAKVQGELFELSQRNEQLERDITDRETELARLAPAPTEVLVGSVQVNVPSSIEARLTLRYQVRNASWQPFYDARLATGSRNQAARLELVRRASIQQSTSEPWNDVQLTLSTVRPSGRSAAPEVGSVAIDFVPEAKPSVVGTFSMGTRQDGIRRPMAEAAPAPMAAKKDRRLAGPGRAATESEAMISADAFQASFAIKDVTTVANDGTVKKVRIDAAEVEPELSVRTVPRQDPRAYLYAKFKLPAGTPFLAGSVALFRDGTFIGYGRLPQLSGGEQHDLGFGADDLVVVKFSVGDEKRGETGIISSSRTDRRSYKISVTNLHERSVGYAILDRIPVALNEDIKIVRSGSSAPSRQNVDDKRGVVAWDGKLDPQQVMEFDFGYQITWPADKEITYR